MITTTLARLELATPDINLNGSSADRLLQDHIAVLDALTTLRKALSEVTPHGRDYLPQGGGDFGRARDEHWTRMKAVERLEREISAIAGAIVQQRDERHARRAQ